VKFLLSGLLLATLVLGSGCTSLSQTERNHAAGIAATARSTVVNCTQANRCAQRSPLRALGEEAINTSTAASPRHYATIVDQGEQSLVARLNLIRSATRSVDLQTYIFDKDDSARMVLDALVDAAQRGVRVRILIDQLSAIADLQILGALASSHENLQLRVYNPTFSKVKLNYFDYVGSVLCCFRRFNQRMHNKLLVVDNVLGVVGGRNYQDDYYDWDSEYNFRDRDVILAGPQVRAMAANFDAFWHAQRSVPAERLNDVGRLLLERGAQKMPPANFRRPDRVARVDRQARDPQFVRDTFVTPAMAVQRVLYVADLPQKHRREHAAKAVSTAPELDSLIAGAQQEVLLQTPYLVLSAQAQAIFRHLRQRPQAPRIVVSTNSLASTDNPFVYALSYKFKRRNIRELGFNVYEFKPFPLNAPVDYAKLVTDPLNPASLIHEDNRDNRLIGASSGADGNTSAHAGRVLRGSRRGGRAPGGSEVDRRVLRTEMRRSLLGTRQVNKPLPVTRSGVRMGLHAKSLVVDRRIGVIGTHNFDPRSENYNTEAALVIDDARFAQALAASIERDIAPENSWTVAPREKVPMLSGLNYSMSKVSEALPVLDFWPWRYATNYAFQPGPDCPFPLKRQDPHFRQCYVAVGDFPEVNLGPKWLLVRMLTAFGGGLVPIL